MTLEERNQYALQVIYYQLKIASPIDSGNLMLNGIRLFKDFIGIGGEVATYARATNEKWESPRWHGKQNPNEKWIERTIELVQPLIKQIMEEPITQKDLENHLLFQEAYAGNKLDNRLKEIADKGAKIK